MLFFRGAELGAVAGNRRLYGREVGRHGVQDRATRWRRRAYSTG